MKKLVSIGLFATTMFFGLVSTNDAIAGCTQCNPSMAECFRVVSEDANGKVTVNIYHGQESECGNEQ